MDFARAQAAFNLMMAPQDMRREDVIHLFFKAHSRWEKSKYYSWCQDYHQEAAWAAKDWADENVEVRPYVCSKAVVCLCRKVGKLWKKPLQLQLF